MDRYVVTHWTGVEIDRPVCQNGTRPRHLVYNEFAANRQVWYHSAVYAMAPQISCWEAKADYVIQRQYMSDCSEMIGRLIRALKAWDDLRFHLGALQTLDTYDDVADCVDRILWSLCGAVDVIARSLHLALQLPGSERNAKFHGDWYRTQFRPNYAQALGISNVDTTQAALSTVFKLRNTIHYHSLRAVGALKEPAPYVGKEHGRVQLLIPHVHSGPRLRASQPAGRGGGFGAWRGCSCRGNRCVGTLFALLGRRQPIRSAVGIMSEIRAGCTIGCRRQRRTGRGDKVARPVSGARRPFQRRRECPPFATRSC
jgi:hypothetical protein